MSEWLRLIDAIKRNATDEFLTPTQRVAYQSVCELLRFPQRLNLWGPTGSGKTFVAWAIARTTGAIHLPLPDAIERVDEGSEILLIDSAPIDETAVRGLWAKCNLLGVRSVVLITHEPVMMSMRRIMLEAPSGGRLAICKPNAYAARLFPPVPRTGMYKFLVIPSWPILR